MAELDVGVGVAISTLSTEVRKLRQHQEAQDKRMTDQRFLMSGTVDPAGQAILKSPECPAGRLWVVRRIVIGGQYWMTAVAGSAVAAVSGAGIDSDVGVPIPSIVDQASSLPNVAFYEEHQIVIKASERLYVVISGGTSTQSISATVQLVDEPA